MSRARGIRDADRGRLHECIQQHFSILGPRTRHRGIEASRHRGIEAARHRPVCRYHVTCYNGFTDRRATMKYNNAPSTSNPSTVSLERIVLFGSHRTAPQRNATHTVAVAVAVAVALLVARSRLNRDRYRDTSAVVVVVVTENSNPFDRYCISIHTALSSIFFDSFPTFVSIINCN